MELSWLAMIELVQTDTFVTHRPGMDGLYDASHRIPLVSRNSRP